MTRIGIDEISYKRNHKYLTVVVDHDTGRLVWAAPGRDKATLHRFFDQLGPNACAADHPRQSADRADWIAEVVAERVPDAVRCADPFHVVAWATDALDEVRRQAWNAARGDSPRTDPTPPADSRRPRRHRARQAALKNARLRAVEEPREPHRSTNAPNSAWIAKTDPRLHRAYLLKEALRLVFQLPYDEAAEALDRWIGWARRCRIPAFVRLQRSIVEQRATILAAIEHGLSNGLIESVNTKIRLLTRIAFGFTTPAPSSPSPCSPSVATGQRSPAGPDPHIRQERLNSPREAGVHLHTVMNQRRPPRPPG